MKHEKIIKRDNGDRVKISVSIYVESFGNDFKYNYGVDICPAGRRKFTYGYGEATPEEIHQAKLELWEKIKPVE